MDSKNFKGKRETGEGKKKMRPPGTNHTTTLTRATPLQKKML